MGLTAVTLTIPETCILLELQQEVKQNASEHLEITLDVMCDFFVCVIVFCQTEVIRVRQDLDLKI